MSMPCSCCVNYIMFKLFMLYCSDDIMLNSGLSCNCHAVVVLNASGYCELASTFIVLTSVSCQFVGHAGVDCLFALDSLFAS